VALTGWRISGLVQRSATPVHLRERTVMTVTRTRYNRPRMPCDERGEGVISAAIAVLIMAFIGVPISR